MKIFTALMFALVLVPISLSCWLLDPPIVFILSFFAIAVSAIVIFLSSWVRNITNPNTGIQGLLFVAILLFTTSVAFTSWPLRMMFYLSRSDFDAVVGEIQKGNMPRTPVRIGLFQIEKIETRDGILRLWTYTAGDRDGFVNANRSTVQQQFSIWASEELSENWQFIWED